MTRTDYQAVTQAGVTIRTFGDRDIAVKWAKDHGVQHPGLTIDEVTVTELRRRVYRPRPQMMEVA